MTPMNNAGQHPLPLPARPAPAGARAFRVRRVIWLAGLGALLLAAKLWWFVPRPVAPVVEVARDRLELRAGKLYAAGQTAAFSGILVDRYPDGRVQARSAVAGGVLHGRSEGWHTNGVLQVREYFVNGVSHGLRTKWYPNSHKAAEGMIVNGRHDGLFRRWHEDGSLAEEIQMSAGVANGPARAWYPSGFLKAKSSLADGKVIAHQTWKDQEITEESVAVAR